MMMMMMTMMMMMMMMMTMMMMMMNRTSCVALSKQASLFATQSTHNNAKIYIKQADRLPERPKAINAGCPKLTDNTI